MNIEPEEIGEYRIYSKNDILFCTGDDAAGSLNNKAAELMDEGNFSEALKLLEEGITNAPLFFPFLYNAGICTIYLNQLRVSIIYFSKAAQIAPEYWKTHLQLGYIYGRLNKENEAIDQFRIGLKKNPREVNTYILIGDVYFERNQLRIAKRYYEAAIELQRSFPNGLLGLAKIHFRNEEYLKAIILLKSIDISAEYDKAYHYYFAESAYKTGDYKTAVEQYETLLQFKNEKFFLTTPMLLVKHKLEMAKRFIE
jgi:tetratricopeptide (TPR) repeat protein